MLLGAALGDWMAGTDMNGLGLGYQYGALMFGAALALVAIEYDPVGDAAKPHFALPDAPTRATV